MLIDDEYEDGDAVIDDDCDANDDDLIDGN